MTTRPVLYFVSIHEGHLSGPTIFAGHFQADDAAGARAVAIERFLKRPEIDRATLDEHARRFLQLTDEQRERAIKVGYVAIARRSNANIDNAIRPCRERAAP